jgi:hypothetical protein
MSASPAKQLGKQRSRARLAHLEMALGSHDGLLLRFGLDAIDRSDQIEDLVGLGVLLLLEDLPPRVGQAARPDAATRSCDDVVAGVHVDHEATLRFTAHIRRNAAAARRGVTVDGGVSGHETPEERPFVEVLLSHARLVGVDVGGFRNELLERAICR